LGRVAPGGDSRAASAEKARDGEYVGSRTSDAWDGEYVGSWPSDAWVLGIADYIPSLLSCISLRGGRRVRNSRSVGRLGGRQET